MNSKEEILRGKVAIHRVSDQSSKGTFWEVASVPLTPRLKRTIIDDRCSSIAHPRSPIANKKYLESVYSRESLIVLHTSVVAITYFNDLSRNQNFV